MSSIYYARSIRGAHTKSDKLINELVRLTIHKYGFIPSLECVPLLDNRKRTQDEFIHDRDIDWIDRSIAMIADVTNPSLGVGYELAYAEYVRGSGHSIGYRIFCIAQTGTKVSAMISGSFTIFWYKDPDEMVDIVTEFLQGLKS